MVLLKFVPNRTLRKFNFVNNFLIHDAKFAPTSTKKSAFLCQSGVCTKKKQMFSWEPALLIFMNTIQAMNRLLIFLHSYWLKLYSLITNSNPLSDHTIYYTPETSHGW